MNLTIKECEEISCILKRRASEIAIYSSDHKDIPSGVEFALTREIERLRRLAEKLTPERESE